MDNNTPYTSGKVEAAMNGMTALNAAREVGMLLSATGLSLAVTESATGGLISQLITSIPGSSRYFLGGVTAYDNRIKTSLLRVRPETLMTFGAVSSQVAEEMAEGGLRLLAADICVSDTGIAGPGGGTLDKPVGLFYLGLAEGNLVFSRRYVFSGTRRQTRQQAAMAAVTWLRDYLTNR